MSFEQIALGAILVGGIIVIVIKLWLEVNSINAHLDLVIKNHNDRIRKLEGRS